MGLQQKGFFFYIYRKNIKGFIYKTIGFALDYSQRHAKIVFFSFKINDFINVPLKKIMRH